MRSMGYYGVFSLTFAKACESNAIKGILTDKKNTQVKAYRAFRQGGEGTIFAGLRGQTYTKKS